MVNRHLKKTFSIMNHQGSANQSHKMSSHTCQNDCYQKDNKISVGKDVEKRELISTMAGNIN